MAGGPAYRQNERYRILKLIKKPNILKNKPEYALFFNGRVCLAPIFLFCEKISGKFETHFSNVKYNHFIIVAIIAGKTGRLLYSPI